MQERVIEKRSEGGNHSSCQTGYSFAESLCDLYQARRGTKSGKHDEAEFSGEGKEAGAESCQQTSKERS